MRLIDADELMEKVKKWLPPDPCGREEKEFPFETDICVSMLMEIEEAPTAVDLVRCKECQNSEYDFATQIRGCSWFRIPVTDDFFCAKGERKECEDE